MEEEKIYARYAARCARQECCRHDLWQSMLRAKVETAVRDKVLDRLENEGFIDEMRYAQAFVRDKVRYDKWGKVKIRQALYQKQIGETTISEALQAIEEQEYESIMRDVVRKKQQQVGAEYTYEMRQKVARFAIGRGFEPHRVFALLSLDEEE